MSLFQNKDQLITYIDKKIENLQTPIATIEICVYLLSQKIENENLVRIRMALQSMRDISRQLIEVNSVHVIQDKYAGTFI